MRVEAELVSGSVDEFAWEKAVERRLRCEDPLQQRRV
jgi:hypothetical protein